ncbi:MAG: metal transporter [Bacteroidetes bacterium]|nr:metal transporter [Bacteroidota bacterium]
MLTSSRTRVLSKGLLLVLPIMVLTAAILLFISADPLRTLTGSQPPVEELAIERTILNDEGIELHIVNGGPEPVTIAQVQVDEAFWTFEIPPSNTLSRLGRSVLRIPYHWVEGDLHEVRLLTSTGMTFDHTIEVAVATPTSDASRWLILGLIGLFVGIVPVGVGLMWFPFLHRLRPSAMKFVLAMTVGLLVFLLVDTLIEGIELASQVPDVFQALPLVFLIAAMSYLVLVAVGNRKGVADRSTTKGRLWIGTAIAIGIGIHNMGEGMAVGASIAAGEAALGSFLVIGFVIHNVTEGVAIGAPMASDRPGLRRLLLLTLVAGGPAIIGTWIGGFSYTPFLAVIFFAVGAGAILQVVVEVTRILSARERSARGLVTWTNMAGMTVGLVMMYTTALLI